MKIKSKKGSAMVEATMIFPMVIASVVAVLYIIIGLYLSLSLQASLHLALRKECGEISQTVYRVEQIEEFQYEEEKLGLRPIIKMEAERDYRVSKLFTKDISRTEKGRSYVLDEAEGIRILSLAGEVF